LAPYIFWDIELPSSNATRSYLSPFLAIAKQWSLPVCYILYSTLTANSCWNVFYIRGKRFTDLDTKSYIWNASPIIQGYWQWYAEKRAPDVLSNWPCCQLTAVKCPKNNKVSLILVMEAFMCSPQRKRPLNQLMPTGRSCISLNVATWCLGANDFIVRCLTFKLLPKILKINQGHHCGTTVCTLQCQQKAEYNWLDQEKETTFEILLIMNKARVLVKLEYFKKNYPLHASRGRLPIFTNSQCSYRGLRKVSGGSSVVSLWVRDYRETSPWMVKKIMLIMLSKSFWNNPISL